MCPAAPRRALPTAPTVLMTMTLSIANSGLEQCRHLELRPRHLRNISYLTTPPTVMRPWIWPTVTARHPLLAKPLQPPQLTFQPLDHPGALTPPTHPPARLSKYPLAGVSHHKLPLPLGCVPLMKENSCTTSPQGLPPATTLTRVQHNNLTSWDVFLSLFSFLTGGPLVDIVLLQALPTSKGYLLSFSGFRSCAPPSSKPRVACYVCKRFLQSFAGLGFFPP